jgi:S1-C subfamily serine protease
LAWLLAGALALLGAGGCATGETRSPREDALAALAAKEATLSELTDAERRAFDRIVARGAERCVTIRPAATVVGTGCAITPDGWILTAEHVVRGRRAVEVELHDGRTLTARIVATSTGNDFALLKVEARDLPSLSFGPRPALGDRVIAIGNSAKRGAPSASTGVVIYPRVRIPGESGTYYYDAIFHSAPIFPGDSGGPLLDMRGDLVGIHGGFAGGTASVASVAAEAAALLPGAPERPLAAAAVAADPQLSRALEGGAPVRWPARAPRDFAESSEWTIRSVEETLVAVYAPGDGDGVRRVLEETRRRFVAMRSRDARRDDELVRAMLAEVFRRMEERARVAGAAPPESAAAR